MEWQKPKWPQTLNKMLFHRTSARSRPIHPRDMNKKYEILAALLLCTGLASQAGDIRFEDVNDATGLTPHLKTWRLAHAASWGDLDADGWPELYLGAFADPPRWTEGPLPNMLLRNEQGRRFTLDDQSALQLKDEHARTSQVLQADLDQDGDLDMMVATHPSKRNPFPASLWMNGGDGTFKKADPAKDDGYWPSPMGYRNLAAVDLNDDGLLDIVACDNNYSNWDDGKGSLLVLVNQGGMRFKDGRAEYGFPETGTTGLGLAVGDVDDDGRPDFFVADANRLFVSAPDGRYAECQPGLFLQPMRRRGKPSKACGAAFGDLNGDGLLDLATSEHGQHAQTRVYINEGVKDGMPRFRNATAESGLDGPLPPVGIRGTMVKSGHVAIADFDNDGRRDIWLSVYWENAKGQLQPMVYRNEGNTTNATPRFNRPPYDKVVGYCAPAPIGDFDRDGRLDGFMAAWFDWDETPSILFRNVTEGGHWLTVRVKGGGKRNTMGVGAVATTYAPGRGGDPAAFIQRADIVTGTGYSSSEEALAHLGLGKHETVDLVIRWGTETRKLANVAVDQFLVVDWDAAEKSLDASR